VAGTQQTLSNLFLTLISMVETRELLKQSDNNIKSFQSGNLHFRLKSYFFHQKIVTFLNFSSRLKRNGNLSISFPTFGK
jgi:hypothetical protein